MSKCRFSELSVHRALRPFIMVTGLALAVLTPLTAGASTTYCRTDPTVALSNGVSVQLWDTIQSDVGNVNSVNYVLHVPKGVSMTGITYDSTGYLEHVQIVADQSGTHYEDQTTVYLNSGVAQMTGDAVRRDSTVASKNGNTGTQVTLNWCT